MLSIGAFNALLKTLEEPPSYVIFILATTESHKIPITILSRCQKYDFRRITIDTIAGRLMDLMRQEGVEAEERAIRYVAKAGDGSMRDALSLLDQCIAFYLGETLTYERVLEVLGAVDTEVFSRLLRAVMAQDVPASMQVLEDMIIQGRELGQFVNDFVWYLRNLLLIKSSDQMEDVLDMSGENLQSLKEEAAMIESEVIMRYIRIFSELSGQIKYAPQKRVLIEIALIKLCHPVMETTQDALIDRIAHLEHQIREGVVVKTQAANSEVPRQSQSDTPMTPPAMPKAVPEDIRQIVQNWKSITQDMPGTMKIYLRTAHLSMGGDNKLMLVFDDNMGYEYLSREEHRKDLQDALRNRMGKEVEVMLQLNETNRPYDESYPDLEKIIHMDIEIDEEDTF